MKTNFLIPGSQLDRMINYSDAEKFERETGKFEKYFSEKPGGGN